MQLSIPQPELMSPSHMTEQNYELILSLNQVYKRTIANKKLALEATTQRLQQTEEELKQAEQQVEQAEENQRLLA